MYLCMLFHTTSSQHTTGDNDDLGLLHALNDTGLESIYEDMHEHSRCQPMNIPFCENVKYNKTMLPNKFGHQTQQDVISEINIYHPLLRVGCSPDLKLFLCTVYVPICFDEANDSKPLHLLPCRSLCESARQGCSMHMRQFNSEWPSALQCSQFPDKRLDRRVNCVGRSEPSGTETSESTNYDVTNPSSSNNNNNIAPNYNIYNEAGDRMHPMGITRDLGFVCPRNFEVPSYKLHLNGKVYNNCGLPCDDVLLDRNGTQIVRIVTSVVATICFMSTIFTCSTFVFDTKRFKYPSRPIIIIAFCQLMVATCYLIGAMTANKIACNDPAEPPKSLPNMRMVRTVTMGNKKGSCTLLFMALYFFQISTMFWWLMMTISWYMIAKLKWAPEAVSSVARYFHLVSWTIPALLTIYLSVLGNIEGDSLTGTCYVSLSNQESIKAFVIYPALACLTAGIVLLVLGHRSLMESRDALRREYGKQTNEHQRLIMRINMFSFLFILSSALLIYCHYYEQSNLNVWMLSWYSNICRSREYSIPCPTRNFSNLGPSYAMFLLRYVATMAIGLISALFMLSEKTLNNTYRGVMELCSF